MTVKRHALPDTPVVWFVDTSTSPSPTISQLLEAVNEAIPIESDGEWGLEDYAVELKGANGAKYECLHFQHVAVVMKEDDEVMYAFTPPLTRLKANFALQYSTTPYTGFKDTTRFWQTTDLSRGQTLIRWPGIWTTTS